MVKGISQSHNEFIRLVANGTNQDEAYIVINSHKHVTKENARVRGCELAKKYALQIAEAKQKQSKVVEDANNTKEAQIALSQILTQAQVDAELCRLILNSKFDGDRLRAIDIYNKRFGSNAPIKSDVKINEMIAPKIIKKSAK